MKRYFSKFAKVALLLGLFAFPGHRLVLHVIESVAAQTYPNGVIITSPVVVLTPTRTWCGAPLTYSSATTKSS